MKHRYSRSDFIRTATGLAWLAISPGQRRRVPGDGPEPLLSFSTLGCPDWTFGAILDFAADHGYQGVELRGIQRQLDLTKCAEFNSSENIRASRKLIDEKHLKIVDLGSSAELHHADTEERKKNLDEARAFIVLARELNCPYVRVFPNNLPKGPERNKSIGLIVNGLLELGNFAKDTGVTVLMETHGDLVQSAEIEKIMLAARHPNIGLVWDVVNMWTVAKEPPEQVYARLKPYIRHTHIKDLKVMDGKERYVLLGKGDSPIFEAIELLASQGYGGYYSFEWEKLWHPEIDEPQVAIADYANVMKRYFKNRI